MKIRLAAAAAAAIAAPILLPATHALASTTHVASPAISSHVSGGCGLGCGSFGFHADFGGTFVPFVPIVKPVVVPIVHPFVPLEQPCFHFLPILSPCGI